MKRNKVTSVYMIVTADEFELPVCLADTMLELSVLSGYNLNTLYSAYLRNMPLACRYNVIKVNIEEPEDRFNFEDYTKFCKENGLSVGNSNNLEKYWGLCHV